MLYQQWPFWFPNDALLGVVYEAGGTITVPGMISLPPSPPLTLTPSSEKLRPYQTDAYLIIPTTIAPLWRERALLAS